MKCINKKLLVAATSCLMFTGISFADFPTFDDLAPGTTYPCWDTFNSNGIHVNLVPFQQWDGTWFSNGEATITTALWAHGYENELNTNNINAFYDFAGSVGTQSEVSFLFGEYGGNINVAVNGDRYNVYKFLDLDGATIGGCLFTVLSGGSGNDNGEIRITGKIHSLEIGGQELAVDVSFCSEAFEDLPLNEKYFLGDSFVTDMVPVQTWDFYYWDGTPNLDGYIQVTDWNSACGEGQELWTNNINAVFLFDAVSPIENFRYQFGEFGGNINIGINGVFRNVNNYLDLDGDIIGGVTFNVVSGGAGNDCGIVECDGIINKFMLGGQEHTFDCFEWDWVQVDDCEPSYEDLPLGAMYLNGDAFTTGDYTHYVKHFTWSDGTDTNKGIVSVENGGMACSTGNELHYNNATTHIERTDGSLMNNMSFKFGEWGGNLNMEINGDFKNFEDMLDIDGAVIGGVLVTVDWGGGGNDCGQVTLTGDLSYIRMGGQEYWVDCFTADIVMPSIPGDVNGDGVVNVEDILLLIGAWGSNDPDADVNGDGIVNVVDLLILIGNWSP